MYILTSSQIIPKARNRNTQFDKPQMGDDFLAPRWSVPGPKTIQHSRARRAGSVSRSSPYLTSTWQKPWDIGSFSLCLRWIASKKVNTHEYTQPSAYTMRPYTFRSSQRPQEGSSHIIPGVFRAGSQCRWLLPYESLIIYVYIQCMYVYIYIYSVCIYIYTQYISIYIYTQ